MSDVPRNLVRIGKITRAHGIRGEVGVRTDEPGSTTLLEQEAAWLKPPGGEARLVAIESSRAAHEALLVKFAGCPDRTAAEGLAGQEVLLDADLLPELEEGEFYARDLVGLEARSPSGQVLGRVVGLYDAGAVPVLEIAGQRRFEVPLVDTFVRRIDVGAGVLEIEPPEEE